MTSVISAVTNVTIFADNLPIFTNSTIQLGIDNIK